MRISNVHPVQTQSCHMLYNDVHNEENNPRTDSWAGAYRMTFYIFKLSLQPNTSKLRTDKCKPICGNYTLMKQ